MQIPLIRRRKRELAIRSSLRTAFVSSMTRTVSGRIVARQYHVELLYNTMGGSMRCRNWSRTPLDTIAHVFIAESKIYRQLETKKIAFSKISSVQSGSYYWGSQRRTQQLFVMSGRSLNRFLQRVHLHH